jgi:Mn2+/Fe2+ NRAMP family transporter
MNLIGINPMQALYYAAVINGIAAPILLAMVMLIGGNRGIMEDKVNSPISNALGWLVTIVMAASAAALIGTMLLDAGSLPVAILP